MMKIFEQIQKEQNENEYNRTEVTDRTSILKQLMAEKFSLNQSQDVRIIEQTDSTRFKNSYVSKLRERNLTSLSQTMNGFNQPKNLVYLQVKGKN